MGPRFSPEFLVSCGIAERTRGEDLQRDVALQAFVARAIGFGHAARAELPLGPVVGKPSPGPDSGARLNADSVVHGSPQALLAAEVFLCCLHGRVPQQELDLLQLAARNVA